VSIVLDEQTARVFINALRDPKLADTLSILAQSTDPSMPEPIINFAWQRINQTLGAAVWGPAIVINSIEEDDEA
jgi:hypothetical protein